ncbi:LysM domain/BON super protein [Pseudomonas syringae pv. lapsa]|nr:LysM domain/BON super protein [Pseudomonas syringae pv. lapsa]
MRAQANTRSPGAVKPSKRWPRLTSGKPSSSSRLRRRIDSVGWVMLQRAAAWPKCLVSSRAIRNLSCLMSMFTPMSRPDSRFYALRLNDGRATLVGSLQPLIYKGYTHHAIPQTYLRRTRKMSLISFIKEAGEKILDALLPDKANADELLRKHISEVGLGNPNVQTEVNGSTVTVKGQVANQEEREKIVVTLGNIHGVDKVDDQMTVAGGETSESEYVEVMPGDTLSAISKRVYHDANQYQKIFEANKPMLKSADKIYPGQKLRIPK